MIKAYNSMWKNIYNLSGTVTVREFWLACAGNIIAMYIALIPAAIIMLLAKLIGIGTLIIPIILILYIVLFLFPLIPLLIRRIHDSGFKPVTAVLLLLGIPVLGFILIGIVKFDPAKASFHILQRLGMYLLGIGAGMFFWACILFALMPNTFLPIIGLIFLTFGTILGYIGAKIQEKKN
jgi:uncharacterized membrane protein YhaH (DUF805 family)